MNKMNELKAQLKTTEAEIEQLIDSLSGASPVLVSYANEKIEALDLHRKTLNAQIAELSVKRTPPEQIEQLSNHIKMWDKLLMDDKRHVLDMMVDVIYATNRDHRHISYSLCRLLILRSERAIRLVFWAGTRYNEEKYHRRRICYADQ